MLKHKCCVFFSNWAACVCAPLAVVKLWRFFSLLARALYQKSINCKNRNKTAEKKYEIFNNNLNRNAWTIKSAAIVTVSTTSTGMEQFRGEINWSLQILRSWNSFVWNPFGDRRKIGSQDNFRVWVSILRFIYLDYLALICEQATRDDARSKWTENAKRISSINTNDLQIELYSSATCC